MEKDHTGDLVHSIFGTKNGSDWDLFITLFTLEDAKKALETLRETNPKLTFKIKSGGMFDQVDL